MRGRKFTAIIADDNPDTPMIIRELAKPIRSLTFVADATDGEAALAAILKHRPNLAVLDVLMPGLTGRQVVDEITQRGIRTEALLITGHRRDEYFEPTFWAPALGFLYKLDLTECLVPALRTLMRGLPYISPTPWAFVRSRVVALSPENAALRLLSETERATVELLVQGKSDKEIAAALLLSVKTVERLLRRSRGKLGVRSTRGLVAYAVKHGIEGVAANA
jgi:DNA-binding NarL/FixJ family response regulator